MHDAWCLVLQGSTRKVEFPGFGLAGPLGNLFFFFFPQLTHHKTMTSNLLKRRIPETGGHSHLSSLQFCS